MLSLFKDSRKILVPVHERLIAVEEESIFEVKVIITYKQDMETYLIRA